MCECSLNKPEVFTLKEVDDGYIVLKSTDPGDFARVFRLLDFDVPVPSKHGIYEVNVVILRGTLDTEDLYAKTQEGGAAQQLQLEALDSTKS